MNTKTRTRQTLIAGSTVAASAMAALLMSYCLLIGPSPSDQQLIETLVPALFGLEAVTVAALAPAVVVIAGAMLAILLETTRQVAAARETRLELEAQSKREPE